MADSKLTAAQQALNAAKDAARRRAMGPPLQGLSDAALDTLATVSEADAPAADALWRAANPGPLGGLLDATTVERDV